jgi:phenylacetate-CoA ligase
MFAKSVTDDCWDQTTTTRCGEHLMLIHRIKTFAEKLPEPVGKCFAGLPYRIRLGRVYQKTRHVIEQFMHLERAEQRDWVSRNVTEMTAWAGHHHPFYSRYYKNSHLDLESIRNLSDFEKVPILTKDCLQQVPLEERSVGKRGRYRTNTGGSSGQPLVFHLDSQAFAREWAHMHFIWERLGYRPTDLKLVFRGKNLGKRPLVYNPVHNEYIVNAYCPYEQVVELLWKKMQKNRIRFLHGYPSALADFVGHCKSCRSDIIDELRKTLKGILYASEYPAPCYREPVDDCLGVKSISWYGHSEFSVLAYEVDRYVYAPMHTYGYAEAVPSDLGHRLVCTGYYNHVCPFIRYDTGDLIEVIEQDELLRAFRISAGRVGDFVTDANGKQISLTALIFGRHHAVFEKVRFLQIAQRDAGEAIIVLTLSGADELRPEQAAALMDLEGVNVRFNFVIVKEPFRTAAGKVSLKIPYEQVTLNSLGVQEKE